MSTRPVITPPAAQWLIPEVDPHAVSDLAAALHTQPLTARVLVNRGLTDPKAALRFLAPSLDHLHDPLALTGMREAVERLRSAIAS